jgi:hypothetical protein
VDDEAADDGQRVGIVLEVSQHVHDCVPDLPVNWFPFPIYQGVCTDFLKTALHRSIHQSKNYPPPRAFPVDDIFHVCVMN